MLKKSLFVPVLFVSLCLALVVLIKVTGETDREKLTSLLQDHEYAKLQSTEAIAEIPKQDRPDLAMRQNYLMTMDLETQSVPVDRLVTAFQNQKWKKDHTKATFDAIPGVSWDEKGPNNVGGRTRAIMWDPNDGTNKKLWAAGVAGGIWFNNDVTDAASSWQNVDDFMANLAVTTLAHNPSNTQIFYAGTGEGYFNGDAVRGAGIFKSSDGGSTWTILSSTANSTFHYVQRIIVTGSGTILASTRNNGVQRSVDGGVSWNTVLSSASSGASSSRGNDLEQAQNGDIYASLGIFNTGSVHLSTNDGIDWTPVTPPGGTPERIEVAVAASASSSTETTVLYALASNGNNVEWFQKSTDGGTNWTSISIPNYRSQDCSLSDSDFTRGQAWYDLTLAVSPTDPDIVFAGGINVLKSDNGGENMAEISYWTGRCDTYVHADIHAFAFRPGNPNELIVGSDGGISYSADAGSSSDPTFNDRNKDYNVTQFYAVAAQNTTDVNYFLAGAQDNGTQQFTDAGGQSTSSVTGGDGAFCFIDQDDNNFQISSYIRNVYYLLNANGGFVQTLVDDDAGGLFINPADYDNSSNILYSAGDVAGSDTELRRISGITTSPNTQEVLNLSMNSEQISALRADVNVENRVFVGTSSGGLYRVDAADSPTPTVTEITSSMSQAGYVSSIDVGISDDQLVVTISNYGANSVWYSEDGGATWINKDNDGSLPDIPVRWALFNPNNTSEVMLATELGVWSTSDITADSPGWEQSSTNLANVRCDMLQYRSADRLVVVATHGRGVYTSDVFAGADTNPPQVTTLNPTDNSVEVRLDVNLSVQFNESVSAESGNITIQRVSDNSVFETFDVQTATANQIAIANGLLTIDPTNEFEPSTEYRVLIDANSLSDDFGNMFAGITGTDDWTFATFDGDEAPILVNSIPDQSLLVGSGPIEIDLNAYFDDPDGDVITYNVISNSNATLLSTSISGAVLSLTLADNETGVASLTVEASANSKSITDDFQVLVTGPTLFSQSGTSVGGSPSQIFPDFSDSELESADDFTVSTSTGLSWYLDGISVQGSNNGLVPENALFRIYRDASGEPGELFFQSDLMTVVTTTDDSDFRLDLESSLELPVGNYWLSVLVNQDFGTDETQWFWQYYDGGDDYYKRDADQLLAGSWSADWQVDGNSRDMIFSLFGSESIAGPSDLLLAESNGEIQLSWMDNAEGETSYVLEKAVGIDGEFAVLATLNSNTETFIDPVATTNETISYRVFALGTEGIETGKVTATILSLPAVPELLAPSEASFRQFTLNWDTPDEITEFVLDVSEQDSFDSFVPGFENLQLAGRSATVGNRSAGTYFYRVAAVNASGSSAFSDIASITLDPLGLVETGISIFPNPSSGVFNLEGIGMDAQVQIFDLSGKQIRYVPIKGGGIDLSNQQHGSYVLSIRDNGVLTTKTIIKQ